MKSIFRSTTCRWRWKLIFSGFVVPMSTIDWWNMNFQLHRIPEIHGLQYFKFKWKIKESHCKLATLIWTYTNIVHESNFLGLMHQVGVSGTPIDPQTS